MAEKLRLVSKVFIVALIAFSSCDRLPWRKGEAPQSASLKANSELLSEMYTVVLGGRPSQEEFAQLLDALEQGASLEGIYNGLAHSARYRELESSSGLAQEWAVSRFMTELGVLRAAQKNPRVIQESDAQALARMEVGAGEDPKVVSFPGKRSSTKDVAEIFRRASPYVLKRVLADEGLRVLAEMRDPVDRAKWYGQWAAGIAQRGGEFGLEQRNLSDSGFHSQWARNASEDRLTWEVLNRLHRVLNSETRGTTR
jgi:hypothetical protein